MSAIIIPPTPSTLTVNGAPFQGANLNAKQRLAILVQAKIVLLNYKGGTNYIGNHIQLTIDAEAAYKGLLGDSYGVAFGATDLDYDPGWTTVGIFVQQANFRDSVNMPLTIAAIVLLLVLQMARPTQELQKQNAYLDILLLGKWG